MKKVISIMFVLMFFGCSTLKNQHKKEGWVIIDVQQKYSIYSLYRYNIVVKSTKDGSTKNIGRNILIYKVGDTLRDID